MHGHSFAGRVEGPWRKDEMYTKALRYFRDIMGYNNKIDHYQHDPEAQSALKLEIHHGRHLLKETDLPEPPSEYSDSF